MTQHYTIIEVANTHGGHVSYLNKLIDSFEEYKGGYGIKFQPLHPDKLATPDFQWYPVYQQLLFNETEWSQFITRAGKTKDVWLDLFDEYGVSILSQNLEAVYGLKLQVSVLYNNEVIKALSKIDLTKKKLILNVAALSMDEIESFLTQFEAEVQPEEILLEVGFQAYPTALSDSGISKIQPIKNRFGKRIVFADHLDGNSEYALWMPSIALTAGADVIEKHVMLGNEVETEFDMFSSLNPDQFAKMNEYTSGMAPLMSESFINQKESEYLAKTLMKPILKHDKPAGSLISIDEDLEFRRSGKDGLNQKEVEALQGQFHILATDKKVGDTLERSDFKKANIAVIVAGRLKSSRLKEKAVLPIGDLSSVEFCLKNACKFDHVNHVILATSDLETDQELKNHTYSDAVIFHKGDPDDVIQRYLDVIRKLRIDVIVRVTADMPFIENEICQINLKEHFQSGADYTAAEEAAVGTNLEIINTQCLEKIKSHFPKADYSEYMTWYFLNNPEHFRIHKVQLPKELVRDYRLTLDYQEDLDMFKAIHEALKEKGNYTLRDIYDYLDEHPEVAQINGHIGLKYKTDQSLIDTLNKETKIK